MRPAVLVIEPSREIADAFRDVLASAGYTAIVRTHVEQLTDLAITPAAIIVRIAFEGVGEPTHAAIRRMHAGRPPVIAIASTDDELAEGKKMGCEVILRAPAEVNRLCGVLTRLIQA